MSANPKSGGKKAIRAAYSKGKFNSLPDEYSPEITNQLSKLFQSDSASRTKAFNSSGEGYTSRRKSIMDYVLVHSWFDQCRECMESVSGCVFAMD